MAILQKSDVPFDTDSLPKLSGHLLLLGGVLTLIFLQLFRTWWRLRHIPGPFLASLTNLQRVWWVKTKRSQLIHQEMHEKYGEVVRFGPNMVSISDPAAISTVYPMRPGFPKGDFYKVLMPYTKEGWLTPVFNNRDEKLHKQLKNPIAPMYSLTNVVTFESHTEEVIKVFFDQLDKRYVQPQRTVDLGEWLQYFTFEVMGTMTFSNRYGFLEQGRDVGGMLENIWQFWVTSAPVTQIPWYDDWWNKNPWVAMWRQPPTFKVLKIASEFISKRKTEEREGGGAEKPDQLHHKDMLSRFMEIQSTNKSVPPWAETAWTYSNMIAGSDSTAIALCCVWYNLLAHPATLDRLHAELLAAEQNHLITRPFPKWNEVRELPYLDACINEALRIHPPFCLPLERVVPDGGAEICGHFFEGGTVVGINPYVANHHKGTFGEDAEKWRPERWLGLADEEQRKMAQSLLSFGAGARGCLGKNIALLEIKKLVPALLLSYEMELIDPATFRVENLWMFRQKGLGVRIKKRINCRLAGIPSLCGLGGQQGYKAKVPRSRYQRLREPHGGGMLPAGLLASYQMYKQLAEYQNHQIMLALQRISNWILTSESETLPMPSPSPTKSRFESLPIELRLQIYSLLLNGKPEYCHFEKGGIGRSYSIPTLHPAILAVNRSISAEAYPILYGENTFLFLSTTKKADDLDVHHQFLSRLAGLPKLQKPPLLPKRSRQLIKHVAAAPLELARNDWVGRLLELAPAIKTIEFDFWVGSWGNPHALESFTSIPTLNASIPAIKSLVNTSTQTFYIGTRYNNAYNDSGFRFSRRKRVELPGVQLAAIDLKGLDDVQEKSRMVHKALNFVIEIIGQRPPMPENTIPPGLALVPVERRVILHKDFAGFWTSDELPVQVESQGWISVDTTGRSVEVGSECKSVTWRQSKTDHVTNKMLDGYVVQ